MCDGAITKSVSFSGVYLRCSGRVKFLFSTSISNIAMSVYLCKLKNTTLTEYTYVQHSSSNSAVITNKQKFTKQSSCKTDTNTPKATHYT